MNPKSFDHLDPTLKDTYARVMGTDTSSQATTQPANPAVPAQDANFQTDLSTTPTPPPADPMQNQFTPPAQNQSNFNNLGFDPGSGAVIGGSEISASQEPSLFTSSPPPSTTSPEAFNPTPTDTGPSNDTFFSNPTPAAEPISPLSQPTDQLSSPLETPSQTVETTQPQTDYTPQSPVTPYNPEMTLETPSLSEPLNEPLPSPASVNQPHEASPLLRVLYIVGAVVFFAIYTIFWIKVFNLPFIF